VTSVLSALWLLGLYAAAPALRARDAYSAVDRLRDALILGVTIPLVLGIVHLLYPIACWTVLAICIAVACVRGAQSRAAAGTPSGLPPYALVISLVAVSWPQLIRPVLEGDSLSYHLPNAAAWVQAHSLWIAATRYWWYPPASELFASGLYTVGSPFALPWCGAAALALLGFRVDAWARDAGAPALMSDALAAATVTIFPLAIQGGTLQNDVWLAAFWLETLWLLKSASAGAAARTVGVTALIKPQGWMLTAIALLAYRARARLWLAAGCAIALWMLHDAILWRGAPLEPANSSYLPALRTGILAHGLPALATLVHVAITMSPFGVLAFCAALLAPAIGRDQRALAWASFGAAALFLVLPYGYATAVAQLATGASLRFAAPAIASGAVILVRPARGIAGIATGVLLASALFGIVLVLHTFWNDTSTHAALRIAALSAAFVAAAHLRRLIWPSALAFGAAVAFSAHLAARHPVDYYADALRVGSNRPAIYGWIAQTHPAAIGGSGLRLGVVNVLSPQTRTIDLSDAQACAQARRSGVLLVAVAESDRPEAFNAQRLQSARACGQSLFEDATGVAIRPMVP
jgi:hypothetical protein